MANREKGGRVVFIGNIPYNVSEEQIVDLFSQCGPVLSFRQVYDKETGQSKGFGFLEYPDVDMAASAVRNLNDTKLMDRTLRVDYSNDNRSANQGNQTQNNDSNRAPPPAHFNMAGAAPPRPDPSALPPIPQGVDLPPGLTAFDHISQTLKQVDTPQLLDFISQLKNLCASNPQQATALLSAQPQLGYAVFQAMLILGLVDTSIVAQLVASAGPPQPAPPQPPQHQPPPMHYPPPQPPQAQYPGYPPGYGQQQQQYAPTPPQQAAYQPPPQAAPAQPDQAQLIETVKGLSRDQILQLPEPHRSQVMQIRASIGMPV